MKLTKGCAYKYIIFTVLILANILYDNKKRCMIKKNLRISSCGIISRLLKSNSNYNSFNKNYNFTSAISELQFSNFWNLDILQKDIFSNIHNNKNKPQSYIIHKRLMSEKGDNNNNNHQK
ncbi:hypothetical protein PFHG_02346 [Plasmodium falciparum HB3]|uniref:Uncharacterized protein n=1 Tax=Plasmodium falciparum (isolate HB3) TaxID=137071 RepID=A0A0L7KC12_PLAFX|nr:hypothetical protein PFHG_02346 [Plasmodium falciparum HB3]